jgi:hypothetical protein
MQCLKNRPARVFYAALSALIFFCAVVRADVATVQDQEAKQKYTAATTQVPARAKKAPKKDVLITDLSAGVTHGVDSNPLLDSTHKADNYTEETLDMHYMYGLPDSKWGPSSLRFGFNVMNVNYWNQTDVNIFDGIGDANLDVQVCKNLTMTSGYAFEYMWYPHASTGNFIGNEANFFFRHKITDWLYQRAGYRFLYRNYFDRKIMLSNGNQGSQLRRDERNVLRHEMGAYVGDIAKLKCINEYYWNESNFQYLDYYDYTQYRIGGSLITILMPKVFGTASFYYTRRRYDHRTLSDNDQSTQRDNLYTVTGSIIYDITKNFSIFASYSHSENHTNEPLEQYVDTLYTFGANYLF